ncbi:hypothetical protein F5Y14DRAFT_439926 [Nemania sp. NC0429]|nr:hypothetical protein F5Y14DRAFT_439926 [Nemania sp. NC0429]
MPPAYSTPLLYSLVSRDNTSSITSTQPVAHVVCAWPVSGQYGFGTRLLYYFLVTTCVLARRKEWLRNACLAAALLLPAVAAIHAVVLAAVQYVAPAVDMDIYGAFQLCSIGILAAPITVYNSKTYFNDPGRNIIFLWTGLLLAGMLSLTVEFFRTETHGCPFDNMGMPIDPFNSTAFPYGNANCGLHCEYGGAGPFSLIRRDSTNEPAVIPVPQRLTFSAVTLLAAGSSIPPVLTLIFTWEKILEINWKRRFAHDQVKINDPIEGTNGATPKMITIINGAIRNFLSSIQIPIFSGIVVVLLVFGELNFWSTQVYYQTEPFSSVGQWANVVATALVVLGSLYYVQNERRLYQVDASSTHLHDTHSDRDQESMQGSVSSNPSQAQAEHMMERRSIHRDVSKNSNGRADEQGSYSIELGATTTNQSAELSSPFISDNHRNWVAHQLNLVAEYIGTAAPDRYDNSVFREGQREFPEIPGEPGRVARFEELRDRYKSSVPHEDDASIISGVSRHDSFSSMRASDAGPANRAISPSRQLQSSSHTNGQSQHSSPELNETTASSNAESSSSPRPRRDTLDVPHPPRPAHVRPRNLSSPFAPSPNMIESGEGSPRIVVSAEPEDISPSIPTLDTSPLGPH